MLENWKVTIRNPSWSQQRASFKWISIFRITDGWSDCILIKGIRNCWQVDRWTKYHLILINISVAVHVNIISDAVCVAVFKFKVADLHCLFFLMQLSVSFLKGIFRPEISRCLFIPRFLLCFYRWIIVPPMPHSFYKAWLCPCKQQQTREPVGDDRVHITDVQRKRILSALNAQ